MADTNNTRRRRQEFTGTSKYYNHDRRFGFIYVSIPSGTELNYDIKTADKDDSPGINLQTQRKQSVVKTILKRLLVNISRYWIKSKQNLTRFQ